MSSTSSETALEIELAPPRRLVAAAIAVAILTLVTLALLPLPGTWRASAVLLAGVAWTAAILRWWRAAPRALRLGGDGSVRARRADGRAVKGALRRGAAAGPWTVSLPVRWRGGRNRVVLVSRWMAGAGAFRRLKVFLATRVPR